MSKIEIFEKKLDIDNYIKNYVDVEKFKKCCEECPNYGKTWNCRPFDFDVIEYIKKYEYIDVYVKKINFDDNTLMKDALDILYKEKIKWLQELLDKEKQDYAIAEVLSAGRCQICEKCQRIDNKPCIHKDKCRYSVEALGGDTGLLIKNLFDIDILWGTGDIAPVYFVLVGGILYKKCN